MENFNHLNDAKLIKQRLKNVFNIYRNYISVVAEVFAAI